MIDAFTFSNTTILPVHCCITSSHSRVVYWRYVSTLDHTRSSTHVDYDRQLIEVIVPIDSINSSSLLSCRSGRIYPGFQWFQCPNLGIPSSVSTEVYPAMRRIVYNRPNEWIHCSVPHQVVLLSRRVQSVYICETVWIILPSKNGRIAFSLPVMTSTYARYSTL